MHQSKTIVISIMVKYVANVITIMHCGKTMALACYSNICN